MKLQFAIIFFFLTVFCACNKHLDLAPEDTLVERDVFKTENGADQALSEGYYNLLQAVTGNMAYMFGDFTTRNLLHSAYYDIYDNAEVTPADESIAAIWTAYFKAINTANNVIANIPVYAKFNKEKQDQFIAEAKTIRALAFLDLLKLFGEGALTGNMNGYGLPLQLTPFKGYNTGNVIPRSTNGEVYLQIVKDLEESLLSLPDKHGSELETRSRATKGAAKALLARTFLYMKNYAGAASAAKSILENQMNIYALANDLKLLFPLNPSGSAQNMISEYIFAFPVSHIVSTSTSANNNLGSGYFFKRSFWINPEFINFFEPEDLRVTQLMFKGDSVYNPIRFNDKTTVKFNNGNGRDNVPVIRLAEVVLIRAESIVRTEGINTEAVALLNSIRSRAIPSATPFNTNNFSTDNELLDAIMKQRRFELAFEGFYRYDLIRTNQPLHSPDIPETKKVLPIPQMEIDISNGVIQQNSGY